MLIYTAEGERDFGADPVLRKRRGAWEFWALLAGGVILEVGEERQRQTFTRPTLCAFPPGFLFGVGGEGACVRAVFDYSIVPSVLEQMVPPCGFYRVSLDKAACSQIGEAAAVARSTLTHPTQLIELKQQRVLTTLSLLALQAVREEPLEGARMARSKTEQALKWYETMLQDGLTLNDVCRAVHVSPAHLRRLFHIARGESPKTAMMRVRMKHIAALLTQTSLTLDTIAESVGLADASALSRAVKTYFGKTANQLRTTEESNDVGTGAGPTLAAPARAGSRASEGTPR